MSCELLCSSLNKYYFILASHKMGNILSISLGYFAEATSDQLTFLGHQLM